MICVSARPILGAALAAPWRSVARAITGSVRLRRSPRRTAVAPGSPAAGARILARIRLDPAWAAKPLVFNRPRRADGPRTLKHPGGEPLDRVLEAGSRATAQSGVLPQHRLSSSAASYTPLPPRLKRSLMVASIRPSHATTRRNGYSSLRNYTGGS